MGPFQVLCVDAGSFALACNLFTAVKKVNLIINSNDILLEAADGLEASLKIASWWHLWMCLMSCCLRWMNCKAESLSILLGIEVNLIPDAVCCCFT